MAIKRAPASGTPFVSFFTVGEIVNLAGETGLKGIRIVSTKESTERYFKNRTAHFIPAGGTFLLVATTGKTPPTPALPPLPAPLVRRQM